MDVFFDEKVAAVHDQVFGFQTPGAGKKGGKYAIHPETILKFLPLCNLLVAFFYHEKKMVSSAYELVRTLYR
jgi:hypothetical protein